MEILGSTAALITACAALIGGLAALFKSVEEFKKEANVDKAKARRFIAFAAVFFVVGILLAASWSLGRRAEATEREKLASATESLNAKLTREAWDAFNRGDYKAAIAKARECIEQFEGGADRQQRDLMQAKAPEPPTNKFTEAQKRETLSRGLLNDVATCHWIAGQSAEKLGRLEEAKKAYQKATGYTYARAWDPNGWFWSPAESAQDRLTRLEK
jgi:tetratricopeptide (TPR) repeat protein